MLTIESTTHDDVCIICPHGEIDANTVCDFRQALADLGAPRCLVIDLAGVAFLDSAGLGALIGAIRRIREAGGDVALAGARPPLRRLLLTTGLDRIVNVEDTVDLAIHGLHGE